MDFDGLVWTVPSKNDVLYGLCQSVSKGIFRLKKVEKGDKNN